MLSVSDTFKQNINSSSRYIKGMVMVDFAKPISYPFATVYSSPGRKSGYSSVNLCDGRFRTATDYKYTGEYLNSSSMISPAVGWMSYAKSNASGVFSTPLVFTIRYNEILPIRNFWVISDKYNYPVELKIEISLDNSNWTLIKHETNNDSDFYFVSRDIVDNVKYVKITVYKISKPLSEAFFTEMGGVVTVVFEDDDIVDFELIEEMQTDAFSLSGGVTSNQFDVSLRNDKMHFLTANSYSPFYKLLRPEVRIKPYLGVRTVTGNDTTIPDEFEMVPLGVFYLQEWKASTDSLEASMSCADLMYIISQKDKPKVRAIEYITTRKLFIELFKSMGFTDNDYIIESGVQNPTLRVGWIPKGDYIDAMAALAGASNCNVYIDRLGKIRVGSKFTDSQHVDAWTDDNQIISTDNPLRFNDTYSKIEYNWNTALPKTEVEQILNYEMNIVAGSVLTQEVEVNGPLLKLDKLYIENGDGIEITDVEYGSFYMKLTVSNTSSKDQKINIIGTGITVDLVSSTTICDKSSDFNKTLQVSNSLVQSADTAKSYALDILMIASDPLSKIEVSAKGNPAIELKDVIMLNDVTNKIVGTKIFPYYQKLYFSGGLESDVKCIKQVVPKTTAFIGMGMPITIKRRFV